MGKEELRGRVLQDLTLHSPSQPLVGAMMSTLRGAALECAHRFIDLCPEGRELSMALTDLEHALQNAIAGIARNQGEAITQARGEGLEAAQRIVVGIRD